MGINFNVYLGSYIKIPKKPIKKEIIVQECKNGCKKSKDKFCSKCGELIISTVKIYNQIDDSITDFVYEDLNQTLSILPVEDHNWWYLISNIILKNPVNISISENTCPTQEIIPALIQDQLENFKEQLVEELEKLNKKFDYFIEWGVVTYWW